MRERGEGQEGACACARLSARSPSGEGPHGTHGSLLQGVQSSRADKHAAQSSTMHCTKQALKAPVDPPSRQRPCRPHLSWLNQRWFMSLYRTMKLLISRLMAVQAMAPMKARSWLGITTAVKVSTW